MPVTPADPARPAALVVLLTGPSGTGKSSLAARTGLPVLCLDDFYKAGDDPTLPTLPDGGPDWDSPGSWDANAAVAAIETLARGGAAEVPVYDIATSAVAGHTRFGPLTAPAFVAEGIFAADIVTRCRELGVLGDALCLRSRPAVTAWRRFRRDLREARKPVPYLVRRGWRLMREQERIVARQTALGAGACDAREALARIRAVADAPVVRTAAHV